MAVILTDPQDLQGVRDYLGVTSNDLSDEAIQSTGFLEMAEAFITNRLVSQTGVESVDDILDAGGADAIFLKAAVIYRIAYLFAVGETSAVNTSVSIGPITKDLGGIGTSWKDAREEALKDCDQALGSITGFRRWRTL